MPKYVIDEYYADPVDVARYKRIIERYTSPTEAADMYLNYLNYFNIKKVIFNNPATIVFWFDGTKTVVKCEGDIYDKEKGLAMAIAKRALGNTGRYYEIFKKFIPEIAAEKAWWSSLKDNLPDAFVFSDGKCDDSCEITYSDGGRSK